MAALTEDALGAIKDTNYLKQKFSQIANSYVATTGKIILNEAGDKENGTMIFWAIRQEKDHNANDYYHWKRVAKYISD